MNYLLTGPPRCGKTTIIKDIIQKLGKSAGGFYTEEIRTKGKRVGFKLKTLSGKEATFSHVDFKNRYRVGKYGVDLDILDQIGSKEIELSLGQDKIIVIDEIGKMELFSDIFKDLVWKALDSKNPVIGTIMFTRHSFSDQVKKRKDVKIVDVSEKYKAQVIDSIIEELNELGDNVKF
ncbi:MAG: NTPase [Candidatus Zixiibacteriota bacterium]